jgi:glycosyltransferase involved in cell wall biosynthesis
MSGAVEVTVVIPTRDRWSLLSRFALRAALLQEGVEHEVLVVDDGSTDGTPERLAELADPRVRMIRNSAPGRVARARNAGIREARGEWIAFLDDDDSWAPDKLRTQLDAIHSARADFAYAGVVTIDEDGQVLYTTPPPPADRVRYETVARSAIPAGPSNVLVRTALVRELEGFDDRFVNFEDWDLWIRLAWAGRAAAVPETLVAYLEHRAGKSLTPPREAFREFDALERKHAALRAEQRVAFDHVGVAHYVAWLQLRQRRHGSAARVYLRSAFRNRRPQDALVAARFAGRALVPVRRTLHARNPDESVPGPEWLGLYR